MAHPREFAEGLSIGIIMDGNGRWAKNRGLPRTAGHKKGAEVFSDIADYCDELGVSSVYFYAFSTENWKRPLEEVNAIMRAAQQLAEKAAAGQLKPEEITEQMLSDAMYTAGQKDPDFILRPSGEKRLSNFMLWQAAYAELVEMDVLWPDFTRADLDAAIEEFDHRSRRFGGL